METKDAQHLVSMRRPEKNEINEEASLPSRFFTLGKVPTFRRSINYHSRPALMDLVANTLTDKELSALANSPLGVFYKFHKLRFRWASRVVQYALASQVVCNKRYEIWCVFGNHPSRFSLNEFEFLTRLNCSSTENLLEPRYDVDKKKFEAFWSKLETRTDRGPSGERLKKAFETCKSWESVDRMRLAYLCIYVTYIQGIDRREDSNLSLAKMVMNLSEFEKYPWGRVAFHYLIKSVKKGIVGFPWKSLKGFVQALQVWVYVALPEFGDNYAEKAPDVHEKDPPILYYSGASNKRIRGNTLLDNAVRVHSHLTPPGRDVLPEWGDDEGDDEIDIIVSKIKEGVYTGQEWSVEGVYDNVLFQEEGRKRPRTEVKNNNALAVNVRSNPTRQVQDLRNSVSIPVITSAIEDQLLSLCDHDGGIEQEAKRMMEELANNPHFPPIDERLRWYMQKVIQIAENVEYADKHEGRGGERFRDVSLDDAVQEMLRALNFYQDKDRNFIRTLRQPQFWLSEEVCKFPFMVNKSEKYDDCFVTIITSSQHLEAAMDMLRRRFSVRPSIFKNTRICFIGPYLAQTILSNYKFISSNKVEINKNWAKHIRGTVNSPGYLGRVWVQDIDELYMPLHVPPSHWVAAYIDLRNRFFTIWDPCYNLYSDDTIREAVRPYAVSLPYLLGLVSPDYKDTPFQVRRVDMIKQNHPQNVQTGDCGVYTFKYIEYHALGKKFPPDLCDQNIQSIKDRLAVDIFYELDVRGYSHFASPKNMGRT